MNINHEIDIIIPFYNQHRLLSRCLRSIEQSGYVNGQITIVNDRSDPEDVRAICHDVLRHRIGLSYEAEAENINTEEIINGILNNVEIP